MSGNETANQATADLKARASDLDHDRIEAAACELRKQIVQRLGCATGREMSEAIASAVLAAADGCSSSARNDNRDIITSPAD